MKIEVSFSVGETLKEEVMSEFKIVDSNYFSFSFLISHLLFSFLLFFRI